MTDILKPGSGILFMKIGTHAREALKDILARKSKEIAEAGFALWGYGGNTCHPQSMVQPFAKTFERRGQAIYLCMQEMESSHRAEQIRADDYSDDGLTWKRIPDEINVLGSRYALVIKELHKDEFDLPLAHTRVAIGNSQGRPGDHYISGRVDKACLEVTGEQAEGPAEPGSLVHIGVVAKLVEPYAVYVRNRS